MKKILSLLAAVMLCTSIMADVVPAVVLSKPDAAVDSFVCVFTMVSSDSSFVTTGEGYYQLPTGTTNPSWNSSTTQAQKIKSVSFDPSFAAARPTTTYRWFYYMRNIKQIDGLQYLNTDSVTNMAHMFNYCQKLTSLDLSKFNTANVTDMQSMFNQCIALTSLDLSSFNTANVTTMASMFAGCQKATSIKVSSFNTDNVTSMAYMFNNCYVLPSVDVSSFNTSKVTMMRSMFEGCRAFTSADFVSSFKTDACESMYNLFRGCYGLKSVDLSKIPTANVGTIQGLISMCTGLTSVDLSKLDLTGVTNISQLLYGCTGLTDVDLSQLKIGSNAKITNVSGLLYGCTGLKSVDLTKLDMTNITNISSLLQGCTGLTSVTFQGFNTSKVTNMGSLFSGCSKLTDIDFTGINTENVTNMGYMFQNCNALTSLDLSLFNTAKVNSMAYMFQNCKALKTVNFGNNFSTANATSFAGMFYACSALESINLTKFNTSKVTNMQQMFYQCTSLKSLDLSGFDFAKIGKGMFGSQARNLAARSTSITQISLGNSNITTVLQKGDYAFQNIGTSTKPATLLVGDAFDITSLGTATNNVYNWQGGYFKVSGMNVKVTQSPAAVVTTKANGKKSLVFTLVDDTLTRVTTGDGAYNLNRAGIMSARPGWNTYAADIDSVAIDSSFAAARPVTLRNWFTNIANITEIKGLEYLNTSEATEMAGTFYGCSSLTTLALDSFNTAKVTDMTSMFYDCAALTKLDLSTFNTEKVTNMQSIFSGDSALTELNIKSFNTANNQYFAYMFSGCQSLDSIDISTFDISKAQGGVSNMFSDCKSLKYVKLPSFKNFKGYSFRFMFSNCSALDSIDISGLAEWNADSVSSTPYYNNMFSGCTSLKKLIVGNFSFPKMAATYAGGGAFYGVGTATEPCYLIYGDGFDRSQLGEMNHGGYYLWSDGYFRTEVSGIPVAVLTTENNVKTLTFTYRPQAEATATGGTDGTYALNTGAADPGWSSAASEIDSVVIDDVFAYAKPTSMARWFANMSKVTEIKNLKLVNTDDVTNMQRLFYRCSNLKNPDVSYFNTAKVTNMNNMFYFCQNIDTLILKNFDTRLVTDMSWMFAMCSGLDSLDISSFSTENVNYITYMFFGCSKIKYLNVLPLIGAGTHVKSFSNLFGNCSSLKVLLYFGGVGFMGTTIPGMMTSAVTDMQGMFSNCSSLEEIPFTQNFNTAKVTNMESMFAGCRSLKNLQLYYFNTANVTNMVWMFRGCDSLQTVNLRNFNTDKVTSMDGMFQNCASLTNIDLTAFNTANVTSMESMFAGCSLLDSINIQKFNTSKVTNADYFMRGCSGVKIMYVGDNDFASVSSTTDMFSGVGTASAPATLIYGEKFDTTVLGSATNGVYQWKKGYFSAISTGINAINYGTGTDNGANGVISLKEAFDKGLPVYNISGQRVGRGYRGVVILNGKKYLNK